MLFYCHFHGFVFNAVVTIVHAVVIIVVFLVKMLYPLLIYCCCSCYIYLFGWSALVTIAVTIIVVFIFLVCSCSRVCCIFFRCSRCFVFLFGLVSSISRTWSSSTFAEWNIYHFGNSYMKGQREMVTGWEVQKGEPHRTIQIDLDRRLNLLMEDSFFSGLL